MLWNKMLPKIYEIWINVVADRHLCQ